MESETTPQNEDTHEEKHYGRIVGIVVTVAFLGLALWYGATGKLNNFGKVTMEVSPVNQTGSISNTTVPMAKPPVPTENFVIADVSNTPINQTKDPVVGTTDVKALKAPINFKSFSYDASIGKIISVSGTCRDKYYAILVFESNDDYRKEPGAAQSNRAFACNASGLFSAEMDLRDINLSSGSYYLFVADQGSTGSWYNPR